MAEPGGNHALVFGASGVAGWGVVDQLLSNYPNPGTFSRVTALVNRPLTREQSHWPKPSPLHPEFNLVSGINLAEGGVLELSEILKKEVGDLESVTHMFYFAYKQDWDSEIEVEINCRMLDHALGAIEQLSPRLEFVVFISGTKGYGIQYPGGRFHAPFKESMRLCDEEASQMWYHRFEDLLSSRSKDSKQGWTWCEVRPDAIIGFVPNGSTFNLAAQWALYLSTYALVEGRGAQVPFPGTQKAYKSLFNEASSDIIAKLAIWASLNPKETGGQLFNVADQAAPASMEQRWPEICTYFGLEGVGPEDSKEVLKPSEYLKKHKAFLQARGIKTDLVSQGEFLDSYGYYLDFDRQLSLEKARKAGFMEEQSPLEGWYKSFDQLKEAGLIPV